MLETKSGWDTGTLKMQIGWDTKNEDDLGHRDTENADKILGHRDTKNADRLGHRDTKNEDMCGQTDTLKGTNRQTGERKKKEEEK